MDCLYRAAHTKRVQDVILLRTYLDVNIFVDLLVWKRSPQYHPLSLFKIDALRYACVPTSNIYIYIYIYIFGDYAKDHVLPIYFVYCTCYSVTPRRIRSCCTTRKKFSSGPSTKSTFGIGASSTRRHLCWGPIVPKTTPQWRALRPPRGG